jgi:hypothetical protein
MTETQQTKDRRLIQHRLRAVTDEMLEATQRTLDAITNANRSKSTPAHVARRNAANAMALWQVCANARCRRGYCCLGEPLHCLMATLPLVSPDLLEQFLSPRRRPSRRKIV